MATKQQVPVIAARLTEFQEEFMDLPTEDAQWVIMHGKEAARLFVDTVMSRIKTSVQTATSILSKIINYAVIPETKEKFITKDKFKIDENQKKSVKIISLGDNFKMWFLEKIEQPFPGSTIYGRKINYRSVDEPILYELGGILAETTLTEIYTMMELQGSGVDNDLFDNLNASIFYVRDVTGTMRVVYVRWDNNNWSGWIVNACSIGLLRGQEVGYQVFSHLQV
ncbi:MAG: hypothetical protein WC467_00700 [Patescibacteria group bacterium]